MTSDSVWVGASRPARAAWLGRRAYGPTLALQQELAAARASAAVGDTVLLLEHDPVVTLGRNADRRNVLAAPELLQQAGVELVQTTRGGDVTYHGPGQLVGYPILDLKPDRCDVRRYVRSLADAMIRLVRRWQIAAGVVDGLVGVWVDARAPQRWNGPEQAGELVKIGAIGVRLTDWISLHGFALNLTVAPDAYRWIVPCGIRAHPVSSVAALCGTQPDVADVALSAAPELGAGLGLELSRVEDCSQASEEGLRSLLLSPPDA